MSLLDKDVTEDIARGIRTVHEAAKGGIETAKGGIETAAASYV